MTDDSTNSAPSPAPEPAPDSASDSAADSAPETASGSAPDAAPGSAPDSAPGELETLKADFHALLERVESIEHALKDELVVGVKWLIAKVEGTDQPE